METRVIQISIGRFHHFHLARQLEKHHMLGSIYTGYPRFKLADEHGIPTTKIRSFPWLQAPYMGLSRVSVFPTARLKREWAWWAHETLDLYVANQLRDSTILIALSGSGLHSGRKMQQLGGIHICDRGSSHIRYQEQLLADEYERYGSRWRGIDPRSIAKEEAEYEQANLVSIPSQFCYDTFINQGVPAAKLLKIPYGARLERFYPDLGATNTKEEEFRILFVGGAGPRKGFLDLLKAFERFSHLGKKLLLIGSLDSEAQAVLSQVDKSRITFLGSVPNPQLRRFYSQASVFVLPSIEEGLSMVIGEAMACACPIIATTNTGASELITEGVEGFIVPIRSPELIADRLQQLADEPELRERMGLAALSRVQGMGGWDDYGDQWQKHLNRIVATPSLNK
jgi:glycosyltransferase involved in cell wall biosynthesis